MKIATTAHELEVLLELAELDGKAEQLPPDTYQTRRAATRKRVAKALLERYESLLESPRFPAIVAIERGNCTGCHVRLPTMVDYGAHASPSVHMCPHCRRMVYAPELMPGPA
jgi:hypothetical protein